MFSFLKSFLGSKTQCLLSFYGRKQLKKEHLKELSLEETIVLTGYFGYCTFKTSIGY